MGKIIIKRVDPSKAQIYAIIEAERAQPVSFVGLFPLTNETAEIGSLFIEEKYRKQGYAEKAVKEVEEEARKQGFETLTTTTHTDNQTVKKLFKTIGYKEWIKFEKKGV